MILKDLLVIELANVLAGPSAGMFFAEMGADVIKIENLRTRGDVTRGWKLQNESPQEDISAYFASANWGKKSIALDITDPEGKEIIYKLTAKADIVISSYKAGDDKKLGMDYESLKKINPGIIYASVSGYGCDDPRVAYDAVLQAETGFMSMNGTKESGPLKMPVALMDILTAHQLKEAILLGLIKKLKTGEGSNVHVSLFKAAVSSLANQGTNYLFTGKIPELSGSLHPNIAPYGETFTTTDGRMIILAVGSDKQFSELCAVLEMEVPGDFRTNSDRVMYRSRLFRILNEKIIKWNHLELLEALRKKHIPAGLVKNVEEALAEKESEDVKLKSGNISGLRQAVFSGPAEYIIPQRPPHYSEHTFEILGKYLGFTPEMIKSLKADNVAG